MRTRSVSWVYAGWLLVGALGTLGSCSSSDGGGTAAKKTPGQQLCASVASYVKSCGASSPCDDALVADCAKLVDVLSASLISSMRDCMSNGGAPFECLSSSFSGLSPSEGQKAFVSSFCSDCPPVPIPGCETAILGGGSVPDKLAVAKTLIMPFSDDVLNEIKTECVSGLTCLADFPSCAQGVLAKRAVPTNTLDCMTNALLNGGSTSDGGTSKTCTKDGGAGTGGAGGAGGSGTGGGDTGGTGTGGSGTGGTGTGGTGTGGTAGSTGSCNGACGSNQAQGNCYCDGTCKLAGDCCSDFTSACTVSSCNDTGSEPNDSFATATSGGNVSCFPIQSSQQSGTLVGTSDIDLYAFTGADVCGNGTGGKTKPVLQVMNAAAGAAYCLRAECATGSPQVFSCVSGADQGGSTPTCCNTGGDVVMNLECTTGSSTLVNFTAIVLQTTNACLPYSFTFTYQP